MKKCKLAFTVLTVVLLSLIMAVTASAANAPDRETANDIFYDMGFSTWGNGYFGCSVTAPEGDPAPDEVVFQYMYLSGALNDYYNDETGYYTIAYDEYIALVDKTFVNHSDMTAYLADYIVPGTNILSWFRGGFGGSETWIPTEYYVNGDYCYVTGVFADRNIEAYPDFVEKEYGKEIINDGDYQAVILHDIILTLKNTEEGWKILEYREAGYYVVEDYLYSFDEMFYRFTFENNGNVTLTECEGTLDYFTGFYGNGSKWHPEISTHSWEIKAAENYYIESVVLTDANGETVLIPSENDVYTFEAVGTGSLKVTTKGIPAIKEYNGSLAYFVGNDIEVGYTGLVEYEGVVYYVENGFVNFNVTTLVYFGDTWYYVENGVVNFNATTLVYFYGNSYYVENGVVNFNATTLVYFDGNWYYVENGVLNWNATTLVYFYGAWYYVENGVVNFDATTLVYFYGASYYVENGVVNFDATTLVYYYGNSYYVENGVLNWNYTGIVYFYGASYYVENGILNWNYTGLTCYYDNWYYIANGVLDWNYTGLVYQFETWFYVEKGKLNWDSNTLVNYNGEWFYTVDGTVAWGYTGLVNYGDSWYHVVNGYLDWNVTTLTNYGGAWYYVENGVLNWSYTGLTCYYGTWYYVENGVLNWNYTGLVNYYGVWYYVENGVLNFINGIYGDEATGIVYFINNGAVDFSFTGFVEIDYYWLYVENGIWDYTFTGTVYLEDGSIAYIQEGVVVDIR